MKEVKKCSISGIAFTMEADAFQVLSRYLESLNDTYRNTDGGKEIVEDIEARIAELILSHQDNSKVVELSLVEEIIAQMGSAEAIREQEGREAPRGEGRIPRRLYRDMDQARLGGVCSGVAKYFGTSPTWIRLLMFLPLILLLLLGWIPFFWWLVPLMSNLLGVFFICYLIMWFAVPAARTARQKLEQNGQRITVQSIEEASAANHDVDADAKPVVAKAVYALGQVVLIVLKLLAGLLVFGLILGACALIIGLFAVGMAGPEVVSVDADAKPVVAKAVYALGQVVLIVLKLLAGLLVFGLILGACALIIGLFAVGMAGPEVVSVDAGIWTVSLGIMTALVPVLLLIYVLMCLIASRKPSRRAVLTTFLIWILIIIGLGVSAVRERERGYEWYEIRTESYDPDMELPALPDPGSADNSLLRVDTPEGMVDLSAGEGRVKIAVEDKEDGEKVDIRVGSKGVKITATEPAAECDDFD